MGRRRKYGKKYSSSSSSSRSSASSSGGKKGFTRKDEKLMIQYLHDYHSKAMDYYLYNTIDVESSDKSSTCPIVIGGCTFPILTEEVLSKPYLGLSKELSSTQRRIIHELCVYADLYHTGIDGDEKDERFIAISIYSDGLEYAQLAKQNHQESLSLFFLKYKPWACCGQTDKIKSANKLYKDEIYKLIDQPSESLRDGIDFLDIEQVKDEDLSRMGAPTPRDGKCFLVDSRAKMLECIQQLKNANLTEIAFDLECYNKSKSLQMTCLLQLATSNGNEYVIDTLAPGVWEAVGGLAPIFADPKIVKIGHAIAGLDVKCLHRDFGIFVVNAFDTYEAAKSLHLPSKGLANVCAHYGLPNCETYQELKATYQNTNWTKRPLEEEMILYGRYDVYYLIKLRKLMMRDLVMQEEPFSCDAHDTEAHAVMASISSILDKFDEDDDGYPNPDHSNKESVYATPTDRSVNDDDKEELEQFEDAVMEEMESKETDRGNNKSRFDAKDLRMKLDLMRVISVSQESCLKIWNYTQENHLKNSEFQSLLVRSKNGEIDEFTAGQFQLYEHLAEWREQTAKQFESSPGFICSLGFCALVALKRPRSYDALRKLTYTLPEILREEKTGTNLYLQQLFQMIEKSYQTDDQQGIVDNAVSDIPSYKNFSNRKILKMKLTNDASSFHLSTVACWVGVIALAAIALSRKR